MVAFFWSIQHCAMPLRVDMRFMLWRAITSLPVVAVLSLIFIRTRRLPPLIVAHWTADALAVLVTALYQPWDAELGDDSAARHGSHYGIQPPLQFAIARRPRLHGNNSSLSWLPAL